MKMVYSGQIGLIYKITNVLTGKSYIGQTTDSLLNRWNVHLSFSRTVKSYLYNSMRRVGVHNFRIELVASALSCEYLDALEQELISSFSTAAPKGYNVFLGGKKNRKSSSFGRRRNARAQTGRRHSAETRRKQSLAASGKPKSDTHHDSIRKPIICLETGIVYRGLSSAARELSIRTQDICNQLKGRQKSTRGYRFMYEECR